jgi:hypothetical protein
MRLPLSPCESSIASKPQNHEGHSLKTGHSAEKEDKEQEEEEE